MRKKTYLIFRHGLATKSLFGYGDSILTAEILPEGIPPIEKIADFLKKIPSSFNVRSEFLRCQQTAAIVSKITKRQFTSDKRLNEYYQESFAELRERVKSFLDEIAKSPDQHIVICTHGAVIAAIKHLLLKKRFTILNQFDYPKTGKLTIIKGETIEEIDFT